MTIESLPAETIIQIFKTATDLEFRAGRLPDSLLSSARVCHRWRCIVLGTPNLFTQILIHFAQLRERNFSITKWTKFWFHRSKLYPINVVIDIDLHRFETSDDDRFQMFCSLLQDYLIPNTFRLQSFHFQATRINYSVTELFSSFLDINLDAPLLEEFVVKCGTVFWPPHELHRKSLFRSNPQLRSLTLHGSEIYPPLANLTCLNLRWMQLLDVPLRQLISDCPGLETLAFHDIHLPKALHSNLDSELPFIPMPSLRNLTLSFMDAVQSEWMDKYKHVLTSVMAPNLQCLSVYASISSVSLSNILPNPSSLRNLHKLALYEISKEIKNRTHRIVNNSYWFLDLPTPNPIKRLHLFNSTGNILGIEIQNPPLWGIQQALKTPSYLELESALSLDHHRFTNLVSVTLDNRNSEEVLWLCRVITARPTIRRVHLSKVAYTQADLHLIVTEDGVFSRRELGPATSYHYKKSGRFSLKEWLGERVELRVFDDTMEEGFKEFFCERGKEV